MYPQKQISERFEVTWIFSESETGPCIPCFDSFLHISNLSWESGIGDRAIKWL